jgi:hypothetical protein
MSKTVNWVAERDRLFEMIEKYHQELARDMAKHAWTQLSPTERTGLFDPPLHKHEEWIQQWTEELTEAITNQARVDRLMKTMKTMTQDNQNSATHPNETVLKEAAGMLNNESKKTLLKLLAGVKDNKLLDKAFEVTVTPTEQQVTPRIFYQLFERMIQCKEDRPTQEPASLWDPPTPNITHDQQDQADQTAAREEIMGIMNIYNKENTEKLKPSDGDHLLVALLHILEKLLEQLGLRRPNITSQMHRFYHRVTKLEENKNKHPISHAANTSKPKH